MPIYEYTCSACRKTFDKLVRSMTSTETVPCPECGSKKTARTLSVFAVGGAPSGKASTQDSAPSCGRCGGAPGSCQMG